VLKNQMDWRKIATTAFVLCIIVGSFGIAAAQPSAPSASVTPSSQQVAAGDQFTVNIDVNPGTYGVSSGELQFAFDASVLQVDDVMFGDLMAAPSSIAKVIDNTAGTVLFAGVNMGPPPVPTAPGTFATITLTVAATASPGTYALDITSLGLADENAAAIPGITITDGTVILASMPTPSPTPTPTPSPTPTPTPSPTPTPTPSPTATPTPSLEDQFQQWLQSRPKGKIVFNPPEEMIVDSRERVEVGISWNITNETLTQGLKGPGEQQIAEGITVSQYMKVVLEGKNFETKIQGGEEAKTVEPGKPTIWTFWVTPKKSGRQTLILTVFITYIVEGLPMHTDVKVYEYDVSVKVNPPYTVMKFLMGNWQWMAGTILIPIVLWLFVSWKKSRGY
jgi:hypothetical protein